MKAGVTLDFPPIEMDQTGRVPKIAELGLPAQSLTARLCPLLG